MKGKSLNSILAGASLFGLAMAAPFHACGEELEKTPAFPGAEGFGKYVTGGRGGQVYHVTSLADSNTKGTLRYALNQPGARTIVFDVSGTIHLNSKLDLGSNTTIAGQTAPGDGICIADYPVSIGSNTIVRYIRVRLGNKNVLKDGADGWDGFGTMDQRNIIIDHCSVSWSIDECFSMTGNTNTTVQWCMVAQSLVNSGHSKGNHGYGGNWGGSGASYHHNMIIHHSSRTPRLGPRPTTQMDERMDMRNNVIYNFGGNGCYGGEGMTVNIVNNYYKPGPGTPSGTKGRRIAGVGIRTNKYVTENPSFAPALHMWGKYYVTGNVNPTYGDVTRDNWTYGMYNQINTSDTDGTWSQATKDSIRIDSPMPFVRVTTHTAEDAYERVLSYVGASLSRDSHDELMVSDARNGKATYTGSGNSKGFINSQDDNKPAGAAANWSAWPTLESTEAPVDTDGDGMPDSWELAHGLNPEDASDGNLRDENGYTNLEHYLNSIVEHITEAQNEGGVEDGYIEYRDPIEEKYEISVNTREGSTWGFGSGISISNDKNGGYTTSGEYVGLGRDQQHTIVLPDFAEVKWLEIEGRGRYSTASYTDASLVEINGIEYPEGTYSLPKGDQTETINVPLKTPAMWKLTMTWKGNNPLCKIYLHTTEFSGVENVAVDNADELLNTGDDRWYTLQGIEVERPTVPGIYINNGRKVVVR